MKNIIVIGGGLSGLIVAIRLADAGIACTLIERKRYPFHRVCGEYISNETVPFLKSSGLFPEDFHPAQIRRLQLTSTNGKSVFVPLESGGFGISRYTYDHFLFTMATQAGATFHLGSEAEKVAFQDGRFTVTAGDKVLTADVVVGAFGKRSRLDQSMARPFVKKRSPYIGVKYHVITQHAPDLIGLHNFRNGYCGISNIEGGKTNLCYLSHRDNLRKYRNLPDMEEAILFRNPFLKSIFTSSEFLFEKPETINEISFQTKGPVEDHVLMTGDAAGMITPLCGNGMAMAIHSAKLLSDLLISFCADENYGRERLETEYAAAWTTFFQRRLWVGQQIQRLFGSELASNLAVNLARSSSALARFLVRQTHGIPF